ncbi:MAG: GntR family transcriptional regulator [Clostridiales bacterium]|jgi:DNA-binding transcriptional regulator YhcF (GntR family)|nr:GntR family transcriptional regulator [Clostridiales bacterium]
MYIEIDFDSGEAIYRQLCRQIIIGIATNTLQEGESLPSVRDLADEIGINMHTVNKAYTVLKEEGFLTVDRRRGAVVYVDGEKMKALEEMKDELTITLAKASCKGISKQEMHRMIDEIYAEYEGEPKEKTGPDQAQ